MIKIARQHQETISGRRSFLENKKKTYPSFCLPLLKRLQSYTALVEDS